MKTLVLILALSTGEETRDLMPSSECYAQMAFIHRQWEVGAELRRDGDDAVLVGVACDPPSFTESLSIGSMGDCEATS